MIGDELNMKIFSGNASESLKMVLKGTVVALDLINKMIIEDEIFFI